MPSGADILAKTLLPTAKSSAEIRNTLDKGIRARSVFSARTNSLGYLERLRKTLASVADGKIGETEARNQLGEALQEFGYQPESGFEGEGSVPPARSGSLRDLGSMKHKKLIIQTNDRLAYSAKQKLEGSSDFAMWQWPAWSFERIYSRTKDRGTWDERWQEAGASVGWVGAVAEPMIALKTSPIWDALGAGEGGYDDAMDTLVPPFAYNSGMGWRAVPRDEAVALGLLGEDEIISGNAGDPLTPGEEEIASAFDVLGDMGAVLKALMGAAS